MFDVIYTIRTRFCEDKLVLAVACRGNFLSVRLGAWNKKKKKIGVAFVQQLSPLKRCKYLIMACQAGLSSGLKGASRAPIGDNSIRAFIFLFCLCALRPVLI